jgi:hypothetical protein
MDTKIHAEIYNLNYRRHDLYDSYVRACQMYKEKFDFLSECMERNRCAFREEVLLRRISHLERDYDALREEHDAKMCRISRRINSLLSILN